jgi:hypothetical protein
VVGDAHWHAEDAVPVAAHAAHRQLVAEQRPRGDAAEGDDDARRRSPSERAVPRLDPEPAVRRSEPRLSVCL